jgi:hypothetical protein
VVVFVVVVELARVVHAGFVAAVAVAVAVAAAAAAAVVAERSL